MSREHGPVGEVRLLLGEHALEPEQQRELPPPLDRGLLRSLLDLGQRGVERATACGTGRERLFDRLAFVDEPLAR